MRNTSSNSLRRDFSLRDEDERDMLLSETWCHFCNEPDLGMVDPYEFEANGTIFLEGKCAECGNVIVSEIDALGSAH